MDSLFVDYLNRLMTLHEEAKAAIAGLPPEALDWVPGPEMNSFNVLAVHLASSERFWVGDMVGHEDAGRNRAQEFVVHGLTEVDLVQRLDESLAHSQQVLTRLLLTDLDKLRLSSANGNTYRASWSLLHNLEHVALHVGHLQLMRQLWEMGKG
jgi:hypothetical protein